NKLFSNKNLVFSDKIVKNSSIKENAIVKHKGIYFFTLLNKSVYNKIKITNLSNNVVEKFYIKTFSIEIVNNFIVLNTKQNEIF
ncbi:MAG: hypothetical protein N2037_14725, partial [Acidimicrobiales bacterium]|nr:hypothetical protein [Acidimicrobiales bacterium]